MLFLVALILIYVFFVSCHARLEPMLTRVALKRKWLAASSARGKIEDPSGYGGIPVQIRLGLLQELLEAVQDGTCTLESLGICPVSFWNTLKEVREAVFWEVRIYFRRNYFGKNLLDSCRRLIRSAFEFLRGLARNILDQRMGALLQT